MHFVTAPLHWASATPFLPDYTTLPHFEGVHLQRCSGQLVSYLLLQLLSYQTCGVMMLPVFCRVQMFRKKLRLSPPVLILQPLPQLLELAHQITQLLAQRGRDGRPRALAAGSGTAALRCEGGVRTIAKLVRMPFVAASPLCILLCCHSAPLCMCTYCDVW